MTDSFFCTIYSFLWVTLSIYTICSSLWMTLSYCTPFLLQYLFLSMIDPFFCTNCSSLQLCLHHLPFLSMKDTFLLHDVFLFMSDLISFLHYLYFSFSISSFLFHHFLCTNEPFFLLHLFTLWVTLKNLLYATIGYPSLLHHLFLSISDSSISSVFSLWPFLCTIYSSMSVPLIPSLWYLLFLWPCFSAPCWPLYE